MQPFPLVGAPVPIKTATQAYQDIVNNPDVGANKFLNSNGSVGYHTDTQDSFYLAKMAEGEGAGHPYQMYSNVRSWFGESMYQNFVSSITGTPIETRPANYDTDRDGMADDWERATFGNLSRDGKGDLDGDGYTDLEEFLNLVDN